VESFPRALLAWNWVCFDPTTFRISDRCFFSLPLRVAFFFSSPRLEPLLDLGRPFFCKESFCPSPIFPSFSYDLWKACRARFFPSVLCRPLFPFKTPPHFPPKPVLISPDRLAVTRVFFRLGPARLCSIFHYFLPCFGSGCFFGALHYILFFDPRCTPTSQAGPGVYPLISRPSLFPVYGEFNADQLDTDG